jgi:hypothetical protein
MLASKSVPVKGIQSLLKPRFMRGFLFGKDNPPFKDWQPCFKLCSSIPVYKRKNEHMKKLIMLWGLMICITVSFAQVQRAKPVSDSLSAKTAHQHGDSITKKQMLRELHITKEQRGKLKVFTQANKAKKEAINNDAQLTPEEKEVKLKELHREQGKNVMSVLDDEQKVKLIKMKKINHQNKKRDTEMDNK